MASENIIERPEINSSKCTLCAKCVNICPKDVLEIRDKKLIVSGTGCMLCSHCYAICPAGAVTFPSILKQARFSTFKYRERLFSGRDYNPAAIVNLFRSRRSIRSYKSEELDDGQVRDLVEFAVTAPSGSNCQAWEFTVINGRQKVWNLAQEIKGFFIRLNRLAASPFIRLLSVPFMGRTLINYYRDHYETVKMAVEQGERGRDRLFHGAPCVIVIHSAMDGSTPVEDAAYAAYNICMLAHYMELGTCLIGFAVEAINRDRKLKEYLDINAKNRIHAVIAAGRPAVKFSRHSLRRDYRVEFL